MKPYLSVIIPARNEAKRLPTTLIDIDRHLSQADFSYEIIVVNGGSKDATLEVAKRFSQLMKNMRVLNTENRGKGWSVREGMLNAKGTIRLFTDADNSTSIDQLSKMLPYLSAKGDEKYDIVIGSRDIKGARLVPPQSWYRRLGGNIGNLIIQVLLLPGIWDTQCGFKAFTGEAAIKLFQNMQILGFAFDVEILILAKKLGFHFKEIPVTWVNEPFSSVKASSYIQFLIDVFKIKWWLMNGKYGILIHE